MDKALFCYFDNGLTRYDGKEYVESLSKLCRGKNGTRPLKAGGMVTDGNDNNQVARVESSRGEPRLQVTAEERKKDSSD